MTETSPESAQASSLAQRFIERLTNLQDFPSIVARRRTRSITIAAGLGLISLVLFGLFHLFTGNIDRGYFSFVLIAPILLTLWLVRVTQGSPLSGHYLLGILFLYSVIAPRLDTNPSVLAPELLALGMLATQIVTLRGAWGWTLLGTLTCGLLTLETFQLGNSETSIAVVITAVTLLTGLYSNLLEKHRRQSFATVREQGKQLQAASTQLLSYVESIFPSIVEASPGRIHYASAALKDELGYSPASLRREALEKFIHPDDLSQVRRHLAVRPPQHFHVEVRVLHAKGHWVWHEAHGLPADTEKHARWYFVARNIELEREMRARDEQQARMEEVGNLAAGIAHDFNNLLTVIRGNAELMPDSRERTEIIGASNEAAVLTRQMLAFSREQPLDMEIVDLATVIQGMRPIIRSILGEEIQVFTQIPEVSFNVYGDQPQLKQVLINLITNARDALEPGGTVRISLRMQEDAALSERLGLAKGPLVQLTVEDNGSGMDTDTLAHAFDPFFSTKGPGHGSGLGLSSAYGVVEKSDGRLELQSEIGKGTKAIIWLPVATQIPEFAKPELDASLAAANHLALVVEDDERIRHIVCDALTNAGYTTLEAGDGIAAMALFQRLDRLPELLVTDVIMPGARGSEIAARMRMRHPDLKVLFISGYPDRELGDWRDRDDGVSFLAKPFNSADIALRANQLLGQDGPPQTSTH